MIDHVDRDGGGVLHHLRKYTRSPGDDIIGDEWTRKIGLPFLDLLSALSFEGFAVKDRFGNTPLTNFAESGAFGLFSRALQRGASARMESNTSDRYYRSLLNGSANGGSVLIMEIVLRDNPDAGINQHDTWGSTPLHAAVDSPNTNVAMVEILIRRGADVNIRDKHGQTPLCYLIDNLSQRDSLDSVLKLLLKHGGDLSALDHLGNTLLHHATRCGHITSMEYLLKQGCNVNARNVQNVTPLHYAEIIFGFFDVFRSNNNSFIEPRRQQLTKVINLLLSWGADPLISGCFLYHDLFPAPPSTNWFQARPSRTSSYACLTPASLARTCPDKDYSITFNESLRKFYPEIYVDSDGEVFWQAQEQLYSPAEGSEFMIVDYRDEALGETELLRRIWNDRGHFIYE